MHRLLLPLPLLLLHLQQPLQLLLLHLLQALLLLEQPSQKQWCSAPLQISPQRNVPHHQDIADLSAQQLPGARWWRRNSLIRQRLAMQKELQRKGEQQPG